MFSENTVVIRSSCIHRAIGIRLNSSRSRLLCFEGRHLLLLSRNTPLPRNELTLFINVALVIALVWVEEGLTATNVEIHQQVSAVITKRDGHLMLLQISEILVSRWHGFRRMMMTAHVYCLPSKERDCRCGMEPTRASCGSTIIAKSHVTHYGTRF